jgi:nanoRNase/pAp phosphatase (c-di-AMP/oligoRNAs hydrolase)
LLATPTAAAVVLPDAPWSRRVSGTLANRLAVEHPRRAHAVFTPQSGRYTVSLRAPRDHAVGADRLALAFGGGGGRAAAAGINGLPEPDIARVVEALKNAYA